jgi:AcrR family transcriptional regulator
MPRRDWLVDGDRHDVATERIYAAATELINREGLDSFSLDALAATAHCSRATIYRYVGGKAKIRDAVMARSATRIVGTVRQRVEGLSGAKKTLTAITVAVAEIRSDPSGQLLLRSVRGPHATASVTASPAIAEFATELSGLADGDSAAAEWIIRLVLSLVFWPGADARSELQMLTRFVAPAMG